jgi:hypothetical protein
MKIISLVIPTIFSKTIIEKKIMSNCDVSTTEPDLSSFWSIKAQKKGIDRKSPNLLFSCCYCNFKTETQHEFDSHTVMKYPRRQGYADDKSPPHKLPGINPPA